jgi:hypothetical protein
VYLYSLILGLVVGYLRKGKMVGLSEVKFKFVLAFAIAMQILSALTASYSAFLVSVSYGLLLLFLIMNWNFDELRLIAVGVFLNALAIWTNNGKMPVDFQAAVRTWSSAKDLLNGTDWKHVIMTDQTPFAIFGDIMYLKYPIPQVISIGDVILSVGLFLLVLRAMDKPVHLSALLRKLHGLKQI